MRPAPLENVKASRIPGLLEFAAMAAFVGLLSASLGQWPLNADEARYARTVADTWSGMMDWIRSDNYPPGYFVLYRAWTSVAGFKEAALRRFSSPFGFFSLLLFGFWVFRAFGIRVGRSTWLLLAFSPFFLLLGRMAKYYSLFIFLSVSSTTLLWDLLEGPERLGKSSPSTSHRQGPVRKLLWAASALALLWVHYLGAVVWAAMGGWLLWTWVRKGSRRAPRLLLILAVSLVGFCPWVPSLTARLSQAESGGRVAPGYAMGSARQVAAAVGYSAYAFALGHTLLISHLVLAGVGCGVAGVAFGSGVVRAWARRRPDSDGGSSESNAPARAGEAAGYCLYLLVTMGVGSLLILTVFLPHLPVMAVSERVGFLLPYAVALAAYGVDRWPTWCRRGLAVAYAVPVVVSMTNLLTARETNVWDQSLPWRTKIVPEVAAAQEYPTAVIFDDYHMGSLGWYYLRPVTDKFVEIRQAFEAKNQDTIPDQVAGAKWVFLVRSARDVSPGGWLTTLEEMLSGRLGTPSVSIRLAFDDPGMRRLKEWFRRGTQVETYPAKILIREYSPEPKGTPL